MREDPSHEHESESGRSFPADDRDHRAGGHDRVVSIVEALLLATVALLAAWSGYSSAKWSTASRLQVAQAATAPRATAPAHAPTWAMATVATAVAATEPDSSL